MSVFLKIMLHFSETSYIMVNRNDTFFLILCLGFCDKDCYEKIQKNQQHFIRVFQDMEVEQEVLPLLHSVKACVHTRFASHALDLPSGYRLPRNRQGNRRDSDIRHTAVYGIVRA